MSDNDHLRLMTTTEQAYFDAFAQMIRCVRSVERFITSAHRNELHGLEALLGDDRAEELRELARKVA